jgi:hypothetical protein
MPHTFANFNAKSLHILMLPKCIPTSHATQHIYSMCVQSHDTFNAVQCPLMPHSFANFNAKSLHILLPAKMHTNFPCHPTHIQHVCKGKLDICAISWHTEFSFMLIHAILWSLSIKSPDIFQCMPKCIQHQLVS